MTETAALLATVREALGFRPYWQGQNAKQEAGRAALDSLAAELEVLSRKLTREIVEHADTDAELERVKAERERAEQLRKSEHRKMFDALERALSALREIESGSWGRKAQQVDYDVRQFARAAIAEIEGEA